MPSAREPVPVPPAEEAAAPELQDLEDPSVAIGRRLDGERDDAVGDRELGRDRDLVRPVLADPQGRRGVGRQVPARSWRNRRNAVASEANGCSALKLSITSSPGRRSRTHRDHATERPGQRVRMAEAGAQVLRRTRVCRSRSGRRRTGSVRRTAGSSRAARRPSRGRRRVAPRSRSRTRTAAPGSSCPIRAVPMTTLMEFMSSSPPRTASSRSLPLEHPIQSPCGHDLVQERARPGGGLAPRRRAGAARAASAGTRTRRRSSAASRVAMLDSARTGMPRACTSRQQFESGATRDEEIDGSTELRPIRLDRPDRVGAHRAPARHRTLGLQEVLGELGSVGVALARGHDPGTGVGSERIGRSPEASVSRPVRIASAIPSRTGRRRSGGVLDILSRVQPMAPGARTGFTRP